MNNQGTLRNKLGINGFNKRLNRDNLKRIMDTKFFCKICKKPIGRSHKFCSTKCVAANHKSKTPPKLLEKIKQFVKDNHRLPVKRELQGCYSGARKYFGTWNNAIEAAGFIPNPVLFANHHKAEDGHICDSLAEKIIDDYLHEHSISHIRNHPYPEGKYTADFKVGEILIEYFGLAGNIKKYNNNLKIKKKLKAKYRLKIIEIFPNDLFPTSILGKKFSILYPYKWIFR